MELKMNTQELIDAMHIVELSSTDRSSAIRELVVRQTQQLALNPFHGFARRLRNVLDPSLVETVLAAGPCMHPALRT